MPGSGVALAWMLISPVAFFTDIIGLLIILHYKPLFHSCDVAFISIFVTMTTNSWLLIPVPAVLKLGDIYWSRNLCKFYTWLSVTLRSSHLLVLLVLNVYWMASLRMSRKGQMFASSQPMKASVCTCWFISVFAGLIPVSGGAETFHFFEDELCKFLPSNISVGFAIFFLITSLLSAVMGFISTLDTLLVLGSMKEAALLKSSASRLQVHAISGGSHTHYRVHSKYSELSASAELCRLVLCFSVSSATLNALPLLVSQFIQLTQRYARETLETALLWLLLIESLTLPHILWLLSSRYRHAAVYTWTVFVMRNQNSKEEDSAACTFQAYRLKVKDRSARPHMNGIISLETNETSSRDPGIEDLSTDVQDDQRENVKSRINGKGQGQAITTDLDDPLPVLAQITSSEVELLHENGHDRMYRQNRIGKPTFSSRSGEIVPENAMTLKSFKVTLPDTVVRHNLTSASLNHSQLKRSDICGWIQGSPSGVLPHEWTEKTTKIRLPNSFYKTKRYIEKNRMRENTSALNMYDIPLNICNNTNNENIEVAGYVSPITNQISTRVVRSVEGTSINSDCYHDVHLNSKDLKSNTFKSMGINKVWADKNNKNMTDSSQANNMYDTVTLDRLELIDTLPRHSTGFHHLTDVRLEKTMHYPEGDIPTSFTIFSEKYTNCSSEQTSRKNVRKSVEILGVYYDDTHTIMDADNLIYKRLSGSTADNMSKQKREQMSKQNVSGRQNRSHVSCTNLIISKVDDDSDEKGERFEQKNHLREDLPKSASDQSEDQHSHDVRDDFLPLLEQDNNVTPSRGDDSNERTCGTFVTKTCVSAGLTDVVSQDYSQFETVGSSNLLHLKIKSIRAAMAVYSSDDTTSDEWGIDNPSHDNATCDNNEYEQ